MARSPLPIGVVSWARSDGQDERLEPSSAVHPTFDVGRIALRRLGRCGTHTKHRHSRGNALTRVSVRSDCYEHHGLANLGSIRILSVSPPTSPHNRPSAIQYQTHFRLADTMIASFVRWRLRTASAHQVGGLALTIRLPASKRTRARMQSCPFVGTRRGADPATGCRHTQRQLPLRQRELFTDNLSAISVRDRLRKCLAEPSRMLFAANRHVHGAQQHLRSAVRSTPCRATKRWNWRTTSRRVADAANDSARHVVITSVTPTIARRRRRSLLSLCPRGARADGRGRGSPDSRFSGRHRGY